MLQTRKSFLRQRRSTSCWTPMTSAGIIAPLRPSNKHGFPSWHRTFIKSQSIQKLEDSESTVRKMLSKPNNIFVCGKKSRFAADWSTNDTELRLVQFLEGETIHRLQSGVWLHTDLPAVKLLRPPWRSTRVSWDRRRSPISWRSREAGRPSIADRELETAENRSATWHMDWAGCSPWWAK